MKVGSIIAFGKQSRISKMCTRKNSCYQLNIRGNLWDSNVRFDGQTFTVSRKKSRAWMMSNLARTQNEDPQQQTNARRMPSMAPRPPRAARQIVYTERRGSWFILDVPLRHWEKRTTHQFNVPCFFTDLEFFRFRTWTSTTFRFHNYSWYKSDHQYDLPIVVRMTYKMSNTYKYIQIHRQTYNTNYKASHNQKFYALVRGGTGLWDSAILKS